MNEVIYIYVCSSCCHGWDDTLEHNQRCSQCGSKAIGLTQPDINAVQIRNRISNLLEEFSAIFGIGHLCH